MFFYLVWKTIVQVFCRTFLSFFGWEYRVDRNLIDNQKRIVAIYPHTSKWDYFLSIFYLLSHYDVFERSYYIIKPQLFEGFFGKFISYFNGLPSSRMEEHGLGTVDRISKKLLEKDEFLFLISPEGMLNFNEWRSGYFNIAKKTNAVIVVLGVDYEKKMIKIISQTDTINDDSNFEEMEKKFKEDMSQIVPLYPENCITSFQVENIKDKVTSVIDYSYVLTYLSVLSLLCWVFPNHKIFIFLYFIFFININQILIYDLFID